MEREAGGRPGNVLETVRQPVAGKNLQLTIDSDVQRVADERPPLGDDAVGLKQGVTIVMNPQTGEILAMVSLPSYDNNKFATGISAADLPRLSHGSRTSPSATTRSRTSTRPARRSSW